MKLGVLAVGRGGVEGGRSERQPTRTQVMICGRPARALSGNDSSLRAKARVVGNGLETQNRDQEPWLCAWLSDVQR